MFPQATFQTAGTKYEEGLDAATNTTKYTKVLAYRYTMFTLVEKLIEIIRLRDRNILYL